MLMWLAYWTPIAEQALIFAWFVVLLWPVFLLWIAVTWKRMRETAPRVGTLNE